MVRLARFQAMLLHKTRQWPTAVKLQPALFRGVSEHGNSARTYWAHSVIAFDTISAQRPPVMTVQQRH